MAGRPMTMRLAQNKDPNYIFGNLMAVSPQDIPPSRDRQDIYLMVNDRFVFSARPMQGFPPGHISLSDPQRQWAQIAQTDTVKVEYYDPFRRGGNAYLMSMDLEIGFAGRKTTDVEYDQDELADLIKRIFQTQMFAPGQRFLMDNKGIPLRFTVVTTQLGDLSMEKNTSNAPTSSDVSARGILTSVASLNFYRDAQSPVKLKPAKNKAATNAIIRPDFKFEEMGIGGLDDEFSVIFRRAFASRIFPPSLIDKLGIQHVKGILLYGPPGTGKTLLARQIGKMLNAHEPKIINGPEVLNKYVGQSEENVRKLFVDAEKESKEKGDESKLHIIIFDELDAVCKQRGSGSTGGTGTGDSVVNQLLSKLDGVEQLNNILLIGMTNRMDMIDDALLRPGRLEVHVEVSLPDENGRLQIFGIHTARPRKNDILDRDVDLAELSRVSKNYSGAEIAGVVKSASSFAFNRHVKVGTMAGISDDVHEMKIKQQDFLNALDEVKPAFGVSEEMLSRCLDGGFYLYGAQVQQIMDAGRLFVKQVRNDASTSIMSVLYHGPPGSGKTAIAAQTAMLSQFPFVQLLSPESMVGFNEMSKIQHISKVFADAHKSHLSILIVDDIDAIIDWSPIGPRFSNAVLSALRTLMRKKPPPGRRMLILATTDQVSTLDHLELSKAFAAKIPVPNVTSQNDLYAVLNEAKAFTGSDERKRAVGMLEERTQSRDVGIGVKDVLMALKTAGQADEPLDKFVEIVADRIREMRGASSEPQLDVKVEGFA